MFMRKKSCSLDNDLCPPNLKKKKPEHPRRIKYGSGLRNWIMEIEWNDSKEFSGSSWASAMERSHNSGRPELRARRTICVALRVTYERCAGMTMASVAVPCSAWNRPCCPYPSSGALRKQIRINRSCSGLVAKTCHWCGITLSSSANVGKTKFAPTREENLSILRSLSPYHGQKY